MSHPHPAGATGRHAASSEVPAAVRGHRRPGPVSRRGLLLGAAAVGVLAAGERGAAALRRSGPRSADLRSCRSLDLSGTEPELVFANWSRYLDVHEGDATRRPSLERFTERTGIKVRYEEMVKNNATVLNGIRQPLTDCQPIGRDLVVLTDWAAAGLVRQRKVQRLDLARMPNVEANLMPSLRVRAWDPTHSFAVPWQSGLAGIAYNGRATTPVRTVDELLSRPDLKGRVTILPEMSDTMGVLLQALGYHAGNFTEAHFERALQVLEKAVDTGHVCAVTGSEYSADLASGKTAACLAWSGDVVRLHFQNPGIEFVVPESGAILFSDNIQVPVKSSHKANAEDLINYYYDPVVAAEVAACVQYICPVAGAHAEMERRDPALAANPLVFPPAELLAKTRRFMPLPAEQERRYLARFQAVTAPLSR